MEEFTSVWFLQEVIDELRQKLHHTSCELEALKVESGEQARKHREEVKQLLNLLKISNQERDDARDHLHDLLHKIRHTNPNEPNAIDLTPKPNSAMTESNSNTLSHSHGSSASSPEFSNINNAPDPCNQTGILNEPVVQDYRDQGAKTVSSDSLIDDIVKLKTLPQRGQLLQAVMEAGPLLQTLLVTGPLPQWSNPPSLQPVWIPPVLMGGCEVDRGLSVSSDSSAQSGIHRGLNPQVCSSASMLDFTSFPVSGVDFQISSGKKQRFQ